jgi:hypothetical protein
MVDEQQVWHFIADTFSSGCLQTDTKTSAVMPMASLLISLVRILISNEVYSLKSYEAEEAALLQILWAVMGCFCFGDWHGKSIYMGAKDKKLCGVTCQEIIRYAQGS